MSITKISANLIKKPEATNGNPAETKSPNTGDEKKDEPVNFQLPAITPFNKTEEQAPIEDRFLRLDQLFSYREKWEKLKESLEKINKFKLSTDGRQDSVTLTDSAKNTFVTYNPDVLRKVIDWLKEDTSKRLQETEQQIKL